MLNEIKNEVGNVSKKVDDLAAAIIPNKGKLTFVSAIVHIDYSLNDLPRSFSLSVGKTTSYTG